MSNDAPGLPKIYLLAALVILAGTLTILAAHFKEAPQQQAVTELVIQAQEKAFPAASTLPSLDPQSAPMPSGAEHPPAEAMPTPAVAQNEVQNPVDPLPSETVRNSAEGNADAEGACAQLATAAGQPEDADSMLPSERETASQEDATFTHNEDGTKEIISGTVAQGDTAAKLLGSAVHDIMQASRKHHSLANIRSGQPYTVVRDRETKTLERFEYEIDAHRKLVVEVIGDAFTSRVESIVYDVQLALLQGTVESSLFQSVAALGESPSLAIVVADVFRWDIDFIRDVQDGDSFSILVEKRHRDGQFKHYGHVLGAAFTNKGKLFEAFLFRGVSGNASHYNAKGASLRKVLLKAPLAFTRITSGYSMGRKHPIFHDVRPHEGVDYAAPTGTPIKAVGDGVVNRKGWQGGYGNTISIRHGAGLESQYGHMSGYARGLAVGTRVRQGQVIGFVGMTGWATGPHLDFRLKQHGRFINPTKAVNPREESIATGQMKDFEERKTQIRNFVSGVTPLYLYNPGTFQ
ncbi:MAG: peptidoglycan DD-metalloendopeptidase family protein [Desulfovibrionaceae bacterium]|nr:peptidoglycan DD-metalloendopeptidase family protein [Desulfovibrionaceae bacterium]